MSDDFKVIHVYTRAQAIADEVLIDVSDMAKEAGFKVPVALTRTVWESFVRVPRGVEGQDQNGRLWDVLWMCFVAVKTRQESKPEMFYRLHVRNDSGSPRLVTLKSVIGPGDNGEPVLTIMLPNED
ncbi:MAG: DUF6573 family protein [Gemmataceae bacterium]